MLALFYPAVLNGDGTIQKGAKRFWRILHRHVIQR